MYQLKDTTISWNATFDNEEHPRRHPCGRNATWRDFDTTDAVVERTN